MWAQRLGEGGRRLPVASSQSCPSAPCHGAPEETLGAGAGGETEDTLPFLPTVHRSGLGQGQEGLLSLKTGELGDWDGGSERQIPSPSPPPMLEPPSLPQAGAGHFVQILVNTPTPSPLQRSLKELELALSPPVFKLLHPHPPVCPSPSARLSNKLRRVPLPHADPGVFLPCPHLQARRRGGV